MTGVEVERRRSQRLYFTYRSGPRACISIPGPAPKTISTKLLSLSVGGLSFVMPKMEAGDVDVGDSLVLTSIRLPTFHDAIDRVEVKIRYIIEVANYFEVSVGCELTSTSTKQLDKIADFVDSQLQKT